MYSHQYQVRIRYAETDQMGIVYYGNYATFYEIARVEALRALGFRYKSMEEAGIMLPVIENHSKFILPAYYDEVITIKTIIPKMPMVKAEFEFEIFNEANKLIHTGSTLLVFMKSDTRKPCRAPENLIQLLEPYFEVKT